jgi:tetratricopeptide (TPR) repeat protein
MKLGSVVRLPLSFLLLGLAFETACQQTQPRPRPLLDRLISLADFYDNGQHQSLDAAETRAEIARLGRHVTALTAQGRDLVDALREVVFVEAAFLREVDSSDLRYVLLPAVLAHRKGSCVGLATLFLALAEEVGNPAVLEATLVPGHFFLRARNGAGLLNIELLRQAEIVPDDFYVSRYGVANHEPPPAYWRALTPDEIEAVVHFNAGNEARRQNVPAAALQAYRRAAKDFPDFAEAQASLGLCLHMTGRLVEALAAYGAALRAQPALPGLTHNIELLTQQMRPL